jgi:hypothetical protein
MPLTNLEPTDNLLQVETKIDAAIDKVNEIDANLAGGTTEQVLKKTNGTDYNYAWEDLYSSGTWQDFTLNTGYTTDAISAEKLQYRKDSNGWVELKGRVIVGVISTNEIAAAMSAGYRPPVSKILNSASYGGSTYGTFVIIINATGVIQAINQDGTNLANGKQAYLDGIRFNTNS